MAGITHNHLSAAQALILYKANQLLFKVNQEESFYALSAKKAQLSNLLVGAMPDIELDTGDLVNDPLYNAMDCLYERGYLDKHRAQGYDPRGTKEWQAVLDLFRLQKRQCEAKCLI